MDFCHYFRSLLLQVHLNLSLLNSSLYRGCPFERIWHIPHPFSISPVFFLGHSWALGSYFHKTSFDNLKISFLLIISSEPIYVYVKLRSSSYINCFMFNSIEIHLPFSVTREPCVSSQLAFNFTGKKNYFILKNSSSWENFVSWLSVPFVTRSGWDMFGSAARGDPLVPSCLCDSCPAFVRYLSTTSFSEREQSLVFRDSTASLKVFDEGPCQIPSGNTNRQYQLKLPYPHACWFLQRTLGERLSVAVALKVITRNPCWLFHKKIIYINVPSNSALYVQILLFYFSSSLPDSVSLSSYCVQLLDITVLVMKANPHVSAAN